MPNMVEPKLVTAVGDAVRRASLKIIMPRYQTLAAHEIEIKSKGELVTAVDRDMEDALTRVLNALEPGVRVVGEEAVEAGHASTDDLHVGRLWLVDPLDGTANFSEGRTPFGVIIALVENGETIATWLYDPEADVLATAALGCGSFVAGRQLFTPSPQADKPTASIAGQFMSPARNRALCDEAGRCMNLVPIPRCAAAHYPMVADGRHDIAVFQRTLPWDHAGGALFLSEAGGRITRWNGQPYRLNDEHMGIIAASSPATWDLAMRVLGDELTRTESEQSGALLAAPISQPD